MLKIQWDNPVGMAKLILMAVTLLLEFLLKVVFKFTMPI